MKFSQPNGELWMPDGADEQDTLGRVTHMAIAAHQDDVEIMALDGILAGLGNGFCWGVLRRGFSRPLQRGS
jgi:hypothetical protein